MKFNILKIANLHDVPLNSLKESLPQYDAILLFENECPSEGLLNDVHPEIKLGLKTSNILIFDAGRFFEEKEWQVPSVTTYHLPKFYIYKCCNHNDIEALLNTEEFNHKIKNAIPVKMDYKKGMDIVFKHSSYFYQSGALITDFCNLACEMCMFHSKNENEYNFVNARRKDRERTTISDELILKYISELPHESAILFSSSGEFLVCKNALKYTEYAMSSGIKTMLLTNGVLLKKEISRKFLEQGISNFIISVDGHTPTFYNKYRKGGIFEEVLKNIEDLMALRDSLGRKDVLVNINCILFEEFEPYKQEIIDFWKKRVDQLSFLAERIDHLGKPRNTFICKDLPPWLCSSPLDGPLLLSNGLIAPCCSVAIGEWFEEMPWLVSAKDMSPVQAVKLYRNMMLDANSPLRQYCKKCHYWMHSYTKGRISPFSEVCNFSEHRIAGMSTLSKLKAALNRLLKWRQN